MKIAKQIILVLVAYFAMWFETHSAIYETEPIVISNNLNVISNASFGSATIGGETRTNWNPDVFDPTVTPVILTSSPTVTLSKASGMYVALDCTNNVFLTVNTNSIYNNKMYRVRLDIRLNNNSLTWDTNYFMSTNITSMLTNAYVPIVGFRPYGGGLIEVR